MATDRQQQRAQPATNRASALASNATAYVLLSSARWWLINLIGTRVFGRLDLTENHVYTLSPASKDAGHATCPTT